MNKSESIAELATALAKAQGESDRETEGRLMPLIYRHFHPKRGQNNTKMPIPARFFNKVAYGSSACWYWVGAQHKLGYGLMTALGESKAHRVAWRLFHGDIPTGMDVCHKCDVRNCVNPGHLFLGTQQDNIKDMVNKGRQRNSPRCGEDNHYAKLTTAQVRAMREERASNGTPYYKIAPKYGITTMTAYRAITGQAWSVLK